MGHLFIGIDGGSTRSTGVIVDENDRVLAKADGGPGNYHVAGIERVEQNVASLIEALATQAGATVEDVAGFGLALSGVWREHDREVIGAMLERLGIAERSTLVSDVEAVLATVEELRPAIAVVAGTGSVVAVRGDDGRLHKVGGHGHLLDDNGSGYDLGISGLRAVLEAADGRGPETGLREALLDATGLGDVDEIVPWLYGLTDRKRVVAHLAPVVIETAAKGDAAGVGIVERAAADLARWVGVATGAVSGASQALTVVLAGGVLTHSDLYRRLVSEQIVERVASAKTITPPHEPAYGAAMIALRAWRGRR